MVGSFRSRILPSLAAALLGAGCASPIGVSVASPRAIHRYLTQSALSADLPSTFSLIELRRYDLLDGFDRDPDATLARLHELALANDLPPDALFALTELSFLRAEETHDPRRYGASAIYAYAFLFPEEERPPLGLLDPRGRLAADLYNRSVALAYARDESGSIVTREGGLDLPFGHFTPRPGPPPDLGGYTIETLRPVAELSVSGLRNRYRRPGLGAPLAATLRPTPAAAANPVPMSPTTHLPLTAVIRIDAPLAAIRSGKASGESLLLPSLDVDAVTVAGKEVPLEAEPTAALAAGLSQSRFWTQETSIFLGHLVGVRGGAGVASLRPYTPGRIPIVFVHGTASSPGRWADMANDLIADDRLRHRLSFWFFRYDSGNPIPYSAWQLRDSLAKGVERADPSGQDPCLRDMLVLGHSQGGLLTKMTAIDSGDAFWRNISNKPFSEVSLDPEDRALLQDVLFVEPLPFVRRVIFLATPHRGSYLAGPQIVRRLAQRLVTLPSDVLRVGADLARIGPTGTFASGRVGTSIDNMSPSHPFIRAFAKIPVAPGVTAHSIIAVDDDEPLEKAGDGVVKYASAHVEPVASELVVRSPHSGMQAAPATVEEVRRILLEHLATTRCPAPLPSAAVAALPGAPTWLAEHGEAP